LLPIGLLWVAYSVQVGVLGTQRRRGKGREFVLALERKVKEKWAPVSAAVCL